MWALLTFVVVAPVVIGLWLLMALIEGITRLVRAPKPVKVLPEWERHDVMQLRRAAEKYNELAVARMARRWNSPHGGENSGFVEESRRARLLDLEYRADLAARKHARALDEYRAVLVDCGYCVTGVPNLLSDEQAQDAALLEEASRELDIELAS